MRGGLVFFRGAGAEARAYLEADHSHADEYYLEGGGAVAQWNVWNNAAAVTQAAALDGDSYQSWVDWKDPLTGESRGTPRDEVRVRANGELRITPSSPRFVEMTVNCDKSLSVAAALDPEVSAALDEAQAAATRAMSAYMAANSVTRVGPRGEQRFVPVDRLESVAVVHRTSRAGDPHRHVHVQWSTRVFAEGKWRSLHTAATLKQQAALRGVGEAAINSHAGLQAALARGGFRFDPETGRVVNLEPHAKLLSKRAVQVDRNVQTLEAQWRSKHPGQEPDKGLRREWDQQAWALDRPRKQHGNVGSEAAWVAELKDAGLQTRGFPQSASPTHLTLEELDVDRLVESAVTAAEARRSAWSIADLEGHLGVAVAAAGVTAEPEQINAYVRVYAAGVASRLPTVAADVNGPLPSWVRHLTSPRVLRVESELRESFTQRGLASGLVFDDTPIGELNAEQAAAARALASAAPLVTVEGAAGSGKTTMLAVARQLALQEGRDFVVIAPTRRAAREASDALGAETSSAHRLVFEHGYRWDDTGRWWRLLPGQVDASGTVYEGAGERFRLTPATRVVVDEAGMIDQDLAHALTTIADEAGAPLAFIGDRAQLPAVGRGGVLDMAVGASPRPLDMTELHRFQEPGYAELTLRMRDREEPGALFDELVARGNLTVHETDVDAREAITRDATAKATAGASVAVAVTSNDTAAEINALIQDAHARTGHTRKPAVDVAGVDGLSLRIGDRIMTRHNNTDLGVDNRDTWSVVRVHRDGAVTVTENGRTRKVPREYVQEHTHLAYASTEYGVQGATVDYAHGMVTDSSSAHAVYVAATRGRHHNAVHIVAGDRDEARMMFIEAMRRDAGDRGVDAARASVGRDLDGISLAPQQPAREATVAATSMLDQMKAAEAARNAARHADLARAGMKIAARPTTDAVEAEIAASDRARDNDLER